MVFWLIGMSGAGKTTIGRALYSLLKNENPATVLIDGDEVRRIFGQDRSCRDYSLQGRRHNARRICEMCAWLDRQQIDVVCCTLSIFEQSHAWNRETFSSYFEVYIEAPMDVLIERNPKDLYCRARRGEEKNVVGVDIPFKPPLQPDLVLDNGHFLVDPHEAALAIISASRRRGPT